MNSMYKGMEGRGGGQGSWSMGCVGERWGHNTRKVTWGYVTMAVCGH